MISLLIYGRTELPAKASDQFSTPIHQQRRFQSHEKYHDNERSPDIKTVVTHGQELGKTVPVGAHFLSFRKSSLCTHSVRRSRSSMMLRTRISATAMAYIKQAKVQSSIAASIVVSIDGERTMLMDAP